jgi:hypothetical protein
MCRFNDIEVEGNKLVVEAAKPFAEQIIHNSVYMGGIPPEITSFFLLLFLFGF